MTTPLVQFADPASLRDHATTFQPFMSLPEPLPAQATPRSEDEELRHRVAELVESVAARDTFIAVAAHELRNPMTPMIGQIDLLLAGLRAGRHSPEQIEQRLGRIRRVMEHYVKRASTLLDVSRITTGKFRLDPMPCDLADLANEVIEAFAEASRYAGSPIESHLPARLPGTWDRLALEQIIDNLLSNAIKYGGRHPVELRVEDLGEQVRVGVRDHGPGISAYDRERIFERFERAVGSSERHAGFGVGLWVVGQLVGAMDGTIAVDQPHGGGSIFSVTLPRHTRATCA